MTSRALEDDVLHYLGEHGATGRATLATALGEKPQTISQALFELKKVGLVIPVGDGRWTTCSGPREARARAYELATLPDGEGEPAVRRVVEDQVQIPPEDSPTTRERVDAEDLQGCLFNAEGILRRALDDWLASDPVARQLSAAIRECQAARLAVDELTP